MPVTATPVFVQTPNAGAVQITGGSTAAVTAITAGTNGSKVVGLTATNNNGSAVLATVAFVRAGSTFPMGTATVAINAGYDGATAAANLLAAAIMPGLPVDNDGQVYFFMKSGDTLTVAPSVSISAGKFVNIIAIYADF